MKLDVSNMRFISKDEWRILTAVEMGMRNHEYVSPQLIESISNLRRTGSYQLLQNLLRNKLVSRESKIYEGYKLSYLGYDFLALRALNKRGIISSVGARIGVGKESDIHIAADEKGRLICLKLHRLGRVSFRNVKNTRDYLRNRKTSSWLYLSRLAALKEYSCLKALYENGFNEGEIKVPEPIDWNRHAIVMELIDAVPLNSIRHLEDPYGALERLMKMIIRLADCGLIHGDFNEFNLLIDSKENITLIDFPQIVNTDHINAEMYFNRDVNCIIELFRKRFGIQVTEYPKFEDITVFNSDNVHSSNKIINIGKIDRDMNRLDYLNTIISHKNQQGRSDGIELHGEGDIFQEEDGSTQEDEENYDGEEDDNEDEEDDNEEDDNEEDENEEDDNEEGGSDKLEYDELKARVINERMNNLWLPRKKKTQLDQDRIRKSFMSQFDKHHNSKGNSGSKKSREYRKTKAMIDSIRNGY
ncbi:RIO-like kinase domain N-terminal region conserved [Cryptosporidium sp. chipmunk genotype I]|uniref:RIO-like kinase domain N-terminal region conserved n=1 Tax=Cryptosporidium sp. chipmunk genotype I TaxID=1280935 RepID=UPI003519FA74|nr:RIO-like kinase domain N-terminal region conserved [Cryptosporidium sp. chipmunk genotype I]